MHVLVTGGTGVVGKPVVDRLLEHGHTVRLFSRHADRDAALWRSGVEPWPGNVTRDGEVRGAAEGCEAVLHVVGIVDEVPPEVTFDNVNVQGTRRIVEEAERTGVRRLVYVSSLGADGGRSRYHASKRAGEEIVARSPLNWLICRPGNVYGPGDDVISMLLKMVRTLPAIPVINGGDQVFQPVWAEDLATALVQAVERDEPARVALDLAGEERVSLNDLIDLLGAITGRHPQRVPVPEQVALAGASLAEWMGIDLPVNADQLIMLLEGNVIDEGKPNALTGVFGVTPTPLETGLALLADSLPEKLPSDGVGPLHRQRFWADIEESGCTPEELFDMVRRDFHSLPPEGLLEVGAEPGAPVSLEEGATMTLAIPLRGHIQVRVEEVAERSITCVTVEGHHLAGVIRFLVRDAGPGRVRFEVRSYTRAARLVDSIGMAAVGRRLQRATWQGMVETVVERCGGRAPDGVRTESEEIPEREAARVERWVEALVMRRKREEESPSGPGREVGS
jgi:nucleoside-diphosphate-sugar epimerase